MADYLWKIVPPHSGSSTILLLFVVCYLSWIRCSWGFFLPLSTIIHNKDECQQTKRSTTPHHHRQHVITIPTRTAAHYYHQRHRVYVLAQKNDKNVEVVIADADTGLVEHQSKAATILADFALSEQFNPLLTNPHVQSIGGFLGRKWTVGAYVVSSSSLNQTKKNGFFFLPSLVGCSWPVLTMIPSSSSCQEWESRERIVTPDGDWFYADSVSCRNTNNKFGSSDDNTTTIPTLLLLHGLESNSESPLTKELMCAVVDYMHVTCLNFRGCSNDGEPNDTIGGYHLGFTNDIQHYLTILKQRRPNAGVFLAGFSLGANVVLKCLGELGATAVTEWNIMGAMALAAPLDQERNALVLARPGVNRLVYTNLLLNSLKKKAQFQLDRFCNSDPNTTVFDYKRAMAAKTIAEFDDAFIAPIYGYTDCWDYYRKTSSLYFLNRIAVPTLIVNAKDDPFFDPAVWPQTVGRHVKMERMDHGGHLGFYFHQLASDEQVPETSWAPNELRWFFKHILERSNTSS